MNEVIYFLNVEIKAAQNRIDSKRCVNAFNGVGVGIENAEELNRRHILFCQQILDMIEKRENEQNEHESSN